MTSLLSGCERGLLISGFVGNACGTHFGTISGLDIPEPSPVFPLFPKVPQDKNAGIGAVTAVFIGISRFAGVAKLVNARDLKSLGRMALPVQARPPAPRPQDIAALALLSLAASACSSVAVQLAMSRRSSALRIKAEFTSPPSLESGKAYSPVS